MCPPSLYPKSIFWEEPKQSLQSTDLIVTLPCLLEWNVNSLDSLQGSRWPAQLLSDFTSSLISCLKCYASATLELFIFFIFSEHANIWTPFFSTSCGLHLNGLSQYFLTASPFSFSIRASFKLRQLLIFYTRHKIMLQISKGGDCNVTWLNTPRIIGLHKA